MHTVVETPTFIKASAALYTDTEREAIIGAIARDPEAGEVMPGTGGFPKRRFARPGMGKSGGTRVVYLYGGAGLPVFLVTVYAKNEKGNLTKAEQNALKKAAGQFLERYGEKR